MATAPGPGLAAAVPVLSAFGTAMTSTRAPGGQRAADRLARLDREREGDLAGSQRRAEAEGARPWRRLHRAGIDILAGEDRQCGIPADDRIERARGVRRRVERAHPDELDHVGR